jgi:hypothetical protein
MKAFVATAVVFLRNTEATTDVAQRRYGGRMAPQLELTVVALPEIAISQQNQTGTVFG